MEASHSSENNSNPFKIILYLVLLVGFLTSMWILSSYAQEDNVSQEILWGTNAIIMAIWLSVTDINNKE